MSNVSPLNERGNDMCHFWAEIVKDPEMNTKETVFPGKAQVSGWAEALTLQRRARKYEKNKPRDN